MPRWPRRTAEERFWPKVDKNGPNGCWLWTGAAGGTGGPYGSFWDGSRYVQSHRFSYTLRHGVIPDGLDVDHLCRNTLCANPDHLEAVTHKTNLLRGVGACARHARQTHCKRGHEFTPENTIKKPSNPSWRECRICHNMWCRALRARKAGKAVAVA